jgi:uncharacterized protein
MSLPDFPPRFDSDIVRPYWSALEKGELSLPACSVCGTWQWYPFDFVRCHAEANLDWKSVPDTGTVFTFTRVHRGFLPNAVPKAPPYYAALVELDGIAGVRIPTVLINATPSGPRIGMRVRLSPQKRSTYTLPAFEPSDLTRGEGHDNTKPALGRR